MSTIAEVELPGEPDDVPHIRRFVRSSLAGERPDVICDVELVLTELVTNASLHGEPPITVKLADVGDRLRVEVEDAGRRVPVQLQQQNDAMTGRGLSLVAAVSVAWGVQPGTGRGKTVWAELSRQGGAGVAATRPLLDIHSVLRAWADDEPGPPTYPVKLGKVPTELLIAAKAHIDNVVRELTLLREGEASTGVALAPQLSALVQTVTVDFAEARAAIKQAAAAAAARGEDHTDLELKLPLSVADAAERYLAALDEADRYARSAHLLTMAPPRSHQVFRRWYVRSVMDQLHAWGRGEQPGPAPVFAMALASEVDRLAGLEDISARLSTLQKVARELARATTAEAMATIAVDNAAAFPGVETARVYSLTPEGVLRSLAWYSANPKPDDLFEDIPISSDVPGAVAARTGEALFLRSLSEIYEKFPSLEGYYPNERALHIVPLSVRGRVLGLLALTFLGGEQSDEAQLRFVQSLAETLSRGLRRLQLPERGLR